MSQTLAQKLKELHNATPTAEADPESAYSSLGAYKPNASDDVTGREHYSAVGRSRIRDTALPVLSSLDAKYGVSGSSVTKLKRVKIFDDDGSEEEGSEENAEGLSGSEDDAEEGSESEDDEEDEDEDDEESQDEEDDGDSVDGSAGDEQEQEDEAIAESTNTGRPAKATPTGPAAVPLNPLTAIHASKAKDIEKGRAIRRQQKYFDELLTARIAFQKAWSTADRLPQSSNKRSREEAEEEDEDEEAVLDARRRALTGISSLSEKLFRLRETLPLAGSEAPDAKRRKLNEVEEDEVEDIVEGESFWMGSVSDSLAIVDGSHGQLLSILNKWSSKIQAASLQQAGLTAGRAANKFSNGGSAGVLGAVEAIEAGLGAKANTSDQKSSSAAEQAFYKTLLREVIEARAGSVAGLGLDSSHLKSEKKKRRDAERGGSKGRRLKFNVHEKAQNFVVPIPFASAWHEEQVDELFSSLLGGAGLAGPGTKQEDTERLMAGAELMQPIVDAGDSGAVALAGLRVF